MLLAVDNVKRVVKLIKDETIAKLPIALNYSAEHTYDERKSGLKDFKLDIDSFLPRLGYLAEGDKFTTNCVCYDKGEFANDDALITALEGVEDAPLYGTYSEIGDIKITATEPTDVKLLVIKKTTMPDGQLAVKFQALR